MDPDVERQGLTTLTRDMLFYCFYPAHSQSEAFAALYRPLPTLSTPMQPCQPFLPAIKQESNG